MQPGTPTYPEKAVHPAAKIGNFWQEEMDRNANASNITFRSDQLFYSPHMPLQDTYRKEIRDDVRGEISDQAVRKILGGEWEEVDLEDPRLYLKMTDVSGDDTYEATIRPTDFEETSAEGAAYRAHPEGVLLLDRVPRGMDMDSDYFFTIKGGRGYHQSAYGKSLDDREEFTVF